MPQHNHLQPSQTPKGRVWQIFSRDSSNGFKLNSVGLAGYKEEILYNEGGETLERVAQRGSGGLIPRNIQDQVGQGSEQLDLVSGVPAR